MLNGFCPLALDAIVHSLEDNATLVGLGIWTTSGDQLNVSFVNNGSWTSFIGYTGQSVSGPGMPGWAYPCTETITINGTNYTLPDIADFVR